MEVENSSINIINNGTLIKGDITASGDFRLDGTLEGNIQLDGKLVVGDTGVVNGNILCQNANIIGSVNGNLSSWLGGFDIHYRFYECRFMPGAQCDEY